MNNLYKVYMDSMKKKIDHKIHIISLLLDILDSKLYKFFPNKKLLKTKKRLSNQLFDLYIYGNDDNTPL